MYDIFKILYIRINSHDCFVVNCLTHNFKENRAIAISAKKIKYIILEILRILFKLLIYAIFKKSRYFKIIYSQQKIDLS